MAYSVLNALFRKEVEELANISYKEAHKRLAVTPLATPIIVGPAVMVTTTIFMETAVGAEKFIMLLVILMTMLASWLVFRQSHHFYRILTEDGVNAVEKIFGLVLAAIGIEMMTVGIKGVFGL